MNNTFFLFIKKYGWALGFALFLFAYSWKVFLKGFLIGPFDFLMGFYDPYYEIKWPTPQLLNAVLHYKNNLLSDVVTVVLPPKLLAIQMIKHGVFPLWNPYQMSGTPILASVQAAVLYWANIFYLLLDPKIAYNIYILLQPLLAFVFMFLYLRNLKLSRFSSYFGSLAFSFSAFFIVWLSWGTLGHAFLWLPLVLFCCDRFLETKQKRYVFWYVFGLVSSFFAGHTQTSIMVFGTVFGYQIYLLLGKEKKEVSKLFAFFGIAILITAIQLLPSYEMYQQSARELLAGMEFYKGQTLFFSSYLQLLFPDFFGHPVTRNWWGKINYAESAIYFGSIATFFLTYFFVALRKRLEKIHIFLLLVFLCGLFVSTQNLLSYLIYILKIPLISSSTFSRYSALFIFAGTALSAFGFDFFRKDVTHKAYKNTFVTMSMFIIILSIIWISTLLNLWPSLYQANLQIIKRNITLPTLFILGLFVSLLGLFATEKLRGLRKFNKNYVRILPLCIILLLSAELFRFAYKYTPFTSPEFFYPNHALVRKLQDLTKESRYMQYFPPNVNSMYSIRGVEGKEPLQNLHIAELASLSKNGKVDIFDRTGLQFPGGPYKERVEDLFSTKYFVDKTDNFRNSWIDGHNKDNKLFDKRFKETWTDSTFKVYENTYAQDRLQVYYHEEVLSDKDKRLKRLIDPGFDYKKSVITSEKVLLNPKKGQYKITTNTDSSLLQNFTVSTSEDGIFVVTDTFYPGWRVYVDDTEQSLLQVNHAFRGVKVLKGNHEVRFVYDSPIVKKGFILSAVGLFLFLLYLIIPKWKK